MECFSHFFSIYYIPLYYKPFAGLFSIISIEPTVRNFFLFFCKINQFIRQYVSQTHGFVCHSMSTTGDVLQIFIYFLRHFYCFCCGSLVHLHTNAYSFHHGVFFFPPWRKEKNSVVERNFLHDGKNNRLLRFPLAVVGKRDRNGGAAT